MKSYKPQKQTQTRFSVNQSTSDAETIEMKIERIVNNKEPITDGAPIIFTERREGVKDGYNIRTDRFDVALDAMDKVSKTHKAKREAKIVEMDKGKDGKAESTQGQADQSGTDQTT